MTYEQQLQQFMKAGNRWAVEMALDTERSLKLNDMNFDQGLIDTCSQWLAGNTGILTPEERAYFEART